MSVHQESLDITKPVEQVENPPDLEYSAVRNDSLAMFGAAIGGAVLGMLLTLLILAIINGGTLSFTGGERLAVFEAQLARIDENVNAVAYNVDVVAQQTAAIQDDVVKSTAAMQGEIESQNVAIAALDQAIVSLDQTRQQFDVFVTALADAMNTVQESMNAVAVDAVAADDAAGSASAGPSPAIQNGIDL
ncbi:MAG: hypothetical protein HC802_07445, partial [Caldilineaceae bacterium]|nr:hypothetical protein [Caldilineaceae bacterium]